MNKLQGFFALERSNLPAVPWKKYTKDTLLDDKILWTIRSAVKQGDDLNLPRKIGVKAFEAMEFAQSLHKELGLEDMVIYYPYFIALKSGVIEVSEYRIVIEAVKEDLWNLVTNNQKDVTIIFQEEDIEFNGNENFLNNDEMLELIDYCTIIKKKFQEDINKRKSVFLEWSFACQSDIQGQPVGSEKLVFYEIRTV